MADFKYSDVAKRICSYKHIMWNNPEMRDIEDVVFRYQKDRTEGKDGISCSAQAFWYGNQLARKAMEKKGITLREKFEEPKDSKMLSIANVWDNGVYKIIMYTGYRKFSKEYLRNGKVLLKTFGKNVPTYIIADSKYRETAFFHCENCGALNEESDGYGSCSYCGTIRRNRGMKRKLVSINLKPGGIKDTISEKYKSGIASAIQKKDPAFSDEEFMGLVQSYAKLWIFTHKEHGIDVVDADALHIKKANCLLDNGFDHITTVLEMNIIYTDRDRLKSTKRYVEITMRRRDGARTTTTVEAFKCPGCGAPVDILAGGKCGHCGNMIDYSSTDWVFCDAKMVI